MFRFYYYFSITILIETEHNSISACKLSITPVLTVRVYLETSFQENSPTLMTVCFVKGSLICLCYKVMITYLGNSF